MYIGRMTCLEGEAWMQEEDGVGDRHCQESMTVITSHCVGKER